MAAAPALYRALLRQCRRLPPPQVPSALAECRTRFRAGAAESDPDKVAELVRHAESRLAFLRMASRGGSRGGGGTFMVRDGKLVKGTSVRERSTTGMDTRIHADDLRRHQQLLHRQRRAGL